MRTCHVFAISKYLPAKILDPQKRNKKKKKRELISFRNLN